MNMVKLNVASLRNRLQNFTGTYYICSGNMWTLMTYKSHHILRQWTWQSARVGVVEAIGYSSMALNLYSIWD